MLKKSLGDFEKIVDYCEGSGCRRQKILMHFGEQVSSSLCSKTRDLCKYPDQISKDLFELSNGSRTHGKNKLPSVIFDSTSSAIGRAYEDVESEFWNHNDQISDPEEEISSSEDEASNLATASIRGRSIADAYVDKRLDCWLRAEEDCSKAIDIDKKNVKAYLRRGHIFFKTFSSDTRYDEYRRNSDFIKEHIFPGGCLPSLSRVTSAMVASSGLCVEHVENTGIHYYQTLLL